MKKIIYAILLIVLSILAVACTPKNNNPTTKEATAIDFNTISGWKTEFLENDEAGMPDVNNNPLVIAYNEYSLEYLKKTNDNKSYDVYRYTFINRMTKEDGTNGDEALQQVDVYKYVYTVVFDGTNYYYEVYEYDYVLSKEHNVEFPGVTREMAIAEDGDTEELLEFINKYSPKNNTLESVKNTYSLGELTKGDIETVLNVNAEKYTNANATWELLADKNGILLYSREVKKTQCGFPVGQTYYANAYSLTLVAPTIDVDFTKIV